MPDHRGEGKGDKDRAVPLPARLQARLEQQVERVRRLHEADLAQGFGYVHLPAALAAKYPNASRELGWKKRKPDTLIVDVSAT